MALMDDILDATTAAMNGSGAAGPKGPGIPEPSEEEKRAAHLAAVRRDEEALRRAGFEVEPTVVPWGMSVNSTGVGNARLKREEWENLPPVAEAASLLAAEVAAEHRLSIPMPISSLVVDASSGKLRREGVTGKPGLTVTPAAWNNLMAMMATSARRGVDPAKPGWFPDSAGSFIGSLPPAWRAEEFDRLRKLANGREVTLKILHPSGNREAPLLYAVTSDRYTDFGAAEVASAVASAAAGDAGLRGMRASVMYQPGTRVSFRMSAHSDVDASSYASGEIFSAGVTVKAWENKGGGVIGLADFLRNKCLNLIVLQHGQLKVFRLRHLGELDGLTGAVIRGISEARTSIDHFVKQWQSAWSSVDALDVITCARRMTAAYEGAKKSAALVSIPGVEPELLLNWILEGHRAEPHASRAGLVNALSRAPQVAEASSPAQAVLIEEILAEMAGRVLEMPEPELISLSIPIESASMVQ